MIDFLMINWLPLVRKVNHIEWFRFHPEDTQNELFDVIVNEMKIFESYYGVAPSSVVLLNEEFKGTLTPNEKKTASSLAVDVASEISKNPSLAKSGTNNIISRLSPEKRALANKIKTQDSDEDLDDVDDYMSTLDNILGTK